MLAHLRFCAAFLLVLSPGGAGAASISEIKVTLFGSPCVLSGPYSSSTLQALHSISPERLPAQQNLGQVRAALSTIKQVRGLPPELESYRSRMARRLEAQFQFQDRLGEMKKTGNTAAFLAALQPHLVGPSAPLKTKLDSLKTAKAPRQWGKAEVDAVTELYEQSIEPYPEEEFHKAIDRIKVRYLCDFDA
jgi:hypothetical protein